MNKTVIRFINIFKLFLKGASWNIYGLLNGSVAVLLFFSAASNAASLLCKESLQAGVVGVEVDLESIFLRKGDRLSLGQWIKGLDSSSVRQRRNVINYLLEEDKIEQSGILDENKIGLSKIKREYPSVYPVVYNRLLEVVRSDNNPDLQLRVFRALYRVNSRDGNLRRLAEMHSPLSLEINIIDESGAGVIEELEVEDGVYRERNSSLDILL